MVINEYDRNYFMLANPNIFENNNLRDPQIEGYLKVYDHFIVNNKKTHAIVVLPTGVGKTGLMGLLPYHICTGKVLIVTPQLTIKDTVIDSLDPDNPESFWYKRNIFSKIDHTPVLIEYDKDMSQEIMDAANIVVLNIHKLQSRLEKSPLNFLSKDYFDMIIIDEAHHSAANTWIETINHFDKAKVVKLTGTPIRSDGVDLAGELVYRYKLSQAMAKGYVKSLRNFEYIPEELYLTLDKDETVKYTVTEILEKGIREEDWVRRSVAFSKECSIRVVETSIKKLEDKRSDRSNVPHKIIAVACSISHAEQIKQIYLDKGYRAEIIHSKQNYIEQCRIKKDIDNHRLDIIINVAMLGEGYDHPYLSIAAIFRPFKSLLPYEQFIGRVLRVIPDHEVTKPEDNIADIVSHKNIELSFLWERYKVEIQESDVIRHLQDENTFADADKNDDNSVSLKDNIIPIGAVIETGQGTVSEDTYLNTELIKKHKEEERKKKANIEKLKKLLDIDYEQALSIYNQTKITDALKRPDLYYASRKRNLDTEIREVIVPELITQYGINQSEGNLKGCRLFKEKYSWIAGKNMNNSAMLATYLNTYLKNEIGKSREMWSTSDYDTAFNKLPIVREYIEKILADYLQD